MNWRSTNRIESVAALHLVHFPGGSFFHEMNAKFYLHLFGGGVQKHKSTAFVGLRLDIRNRYVFGPERIDLLSVDEIIVIQSIWTFLHLVDLPENAILGRCGR